ncbi:MAG TPA: histidine kinase [Gemmataceae bacterium]|nr:histidine kinase [Gemmataceae bacterium]
MRQFFPTVLATAARTRTRALDHPNGELLVQAPDPVPLTPAKPIAWFPWRIAALGFVVCTVLGLCDAAEEYVASTYDSKQRLPWESAVALGLGLWYTWAVLGLFILALARRFPLGQKHWRRRLVLHCAAAVLVAAVKIVADYPLIRYLYCSTHDLSFPSFLGMAFASQFTLYLLVYWGMLLISHVVDYYAKFRERELHAVQLETGLAQARLQLLKNQLQPHFLFNTLNAVSSLIHSDVEAADRMVARLGDLLRLSLEDFGLQEAPLARELEVVRSYLAIEQIRLGARLAVRLDVAPDAAEASAPTFLLQPLVENAIRHGVAPRSGPGCVEVRAWRDEDRLLLEVRDNGPGITCEPDGGVGLSNTRARLLHLYGTQQRLDLSNDPCGGCVARITLPFREHAADSVGDREERPEQDDAP